MGSFYQTVSIKTSYNSSFKGKGFYLGTLKMFKTQVMIFLCFLAFSDTFSAACWLCFVLPILAQYIFNLQFFL